MVASPASPMDQREGEAGALVKSGVWAVFKLTFPSVRGLVWSGVGVGKFAKWVWL